MSSSTVQHGPRPALILTFYDEQSNGAGSNSCDMQTLASTLSLITWLDPRTRNESVGMLAFMTAM